MRLPGLIGLAAAAAGANVVQLGHTTIIGAENSTLRQESFYGIPYAEPPVGALRLQPPVAKFSLGQTTVNATAFGPACIQVPTNTTLHQSEDCLTINVLRPAGTTQKDKLPVLVWIHGPGGGFYQGDSSVYTGGAIVSRSVNRSTPVVYVSLNYRLGPLGFPQGAEAAARGALNLGLKDQLVALQWVNKNIGAFGGDPSKVTVWGHSAGAISVGIHLLHPSFQNLARAAILQSGAASTKAPENATLQQPAWSSFVAAIPQCASLAAGNDTFACIQNATLSVTELVNATGVAVLEGQTDHIGTGFAFAPVFDGPNGFLPALPSEILRAGSYAKIPVITGTVLDEGTSLVSSQAAVFTNDTIVEGVLLSVYSPALVPTNATAVLEATVAGLLELYPEDPRLGSPFGTGNQTFGFPVDYKQIAAIIGDISFDSQRRGLQRASAAHGVRSYGYLFTEPQPQAPAYAGIAHTADLPYAYGRCAGLTATCPTLAETIMDYWLAFVTGLNPNDGKGAARPTWSPYANKTATILQLGGNTTATVIQDTYRAQQLAFIEDNAPVFHQ